jgi:uncharacterized protein YhdP
MNWQGAPYQFNLPSLKAKIQFQLTDGHFIDVNSNAADKVWGALNFNLWLNNPRYRIFIKNTALMGY